MNDKKNCNHPAILLSADSDGKVAEVVPHCAKCGKSWYEVNKEVIKK